MTEKAASERALQQGRASGLNGTDTSPAWMWIVLAALVASHHTAVAWVSQSPGTGLLALVVWGGALLCLEDQVPNMPPAPSTIGSALGLILLGWGLWRTAQITDLDVVIVGMPVVLGWGLSLLYLPFNRLGEFRPALGVLSLMPVAFVFSRAVPVDALSQLTARVTQVLLFGVGVDAKVEGHLVLLKSGGVSRSRAAWRCFGRLGFCSAGLAGQFFGASGVVFKHRQHLRSRH